MNRLPHLSRLLFSLLGSAVLYINKNNKPRSYIKEKEISSIDILSRHEERQRREKSKWKDLLLLLLFSSFALNRFIFKLKSFLKTSDTNRLRWIWDFLVSFFLSLHFTSFIWVPLLSLVLWFLNERNKIRFYYYHFSHIINTHRRCAHLCLDLAQVAFLLHFEERHKRMK